MYVWTLVAVWTVIIAGSLSWNTVNQRKEMFEIARITGEITFDKDILYRKWNSGHGGVYVPVTDKVLPNPFLTVPNRDLTTTSGLTLTLINPAYMNRQVNEMAAQIEGAYGHITSLNPLRPDNAPDPWEAQALNSFEKGTKQVSAVEKIAGEDYMRIMRPFITEKSCLKCHASQGYKEGHIRGGISVSIPMKPLWGILRSQGIKIALIHGFFWIIGLAGIGFGSDRLTKQMRERQESQKVLYESEERYRTVIESSNDGIAIVEEDQHVYVNRKFLDIFGYEKQEDIVGKSLFMIVHPDDHEMVLQYNRNRQQGVPVPSKYEFRGIKKDGGTIFIEASVAKISQRGKPASLAFLRDMTERKYLEEQLHTMSLTDELTGLYNRRGFMALSAQQLKIAERAKKHLLLAFVDLDKMKQINDTLGHKAGDAALFEIATILKEAFRESDIIGRMGGDEFAILALVSCQHCNVVINMVSFLHNQPRRIGYEEIHHYTYRRGTKDSWRNHFQG